MDQATAGSGGFSNPLPGTKIVYSANVDGEIEPCGCRTNPTGGIHRRFNFLEQKADGSRLMVDSGDLFYQSMPVPPFLEKQWNYQARVLLKAYNRFGIDAMAPGELDFAAGLPQFEKLLKEAKFKMLSANLYRKSTGKLLLEPSMIVTRSGKKVALFGVIDETFPLPDELEARDHVEAARKAVAELRKKADVVIALTHIGIEKDMQLAKKVSGIDLIFGAHTQSFLIEPEKVGDTLIFQPSFRGQHVGIFAGGESKMFQIDDRFDSKEDKLNPMDLLLKESKVEIARINKEAEAELMNDMNGLKPKAIKKVAEFQTFTQCAQCHDAQYDFHKNTPHMKAFETLVKAKQSANLDCLKCHTVGMQQPGGWKSVNNLVQNAAGKAISAEDFAKSFQNMDMPSLSKVSKAYVNVQCETCHGAGGGHPVGEPSNVKRAVTVSTCLQCHTNDRAPGWYKNGKLDEQLAQAKLKSLTCPADNKRVD